MELVGFLILFPVVAGLVQLVVRGNALRRAVTVTAAVVIGLCSVALAAMCLGAGTIYFDFESEAASWLCFAVDIALCAVVFVMGMRHRRKLACVLAVVQAAMVTWMELGVAHHIAVPMGLYVDGLSVLMALIIGIIGSGICVYALGYMEDFQAHQPEGAPDRRPFFFFLLFVFLGAMYLIVFSNNMAWMLTGWEATTVCSFLLIGFTRTDEAIANSFRQIVMNVLGGIGFTVGLIWAGSALGTLALDEFIALGVQHADVATLAVALLAFAGLTKAAQMPFHTWLLGAMVAPTPTSALLHSSTMVKAGVFLLVKLAPLFSVCLVPGTMVILVGGLTFMLCSFMAISQSNAKRVLAYSTIANLGLITACAGVGTAAAVWAAIFLILFHAAAKSLLFLCVGTAEHHIGSRDIEDMDNLFIRMPRLAKLMMLGIVGMFVAPFGMLISKWAALASFAAGDHIVLLILLVFGSGATFLFWAKWLGKLSGIARMDDDVEKAVHPSEWASLGLMAVLVVACCVFMPVISSVVVLPYLEGIWAASAPVIAADNLWIMSIIAVLVVLVLLGTKVRGRRKQLPIYLSGVSADNAGRVYRDALSGEREATAHNWYLEEWFGEQRIRPAGEALCSAVIAMAILAPLFQLVSWM